MSSEHESGGFFKTNDKPTPTITKTQLSPPSSPPSTSIQCMHCSTPNIIIELKNIFNINICSECKKQHLKFITKTTCKEQYLLTDYDLSPLKSLQRPNPHKGTWSNMSLYLESEAINIAIAKYKSLEMLEVIKNEKCNKYLEMKRKKAKKIVREYKRKTLLKVDKNHVKHKHVFVESGKMKKCQCGLEYEEEDI